MFVETYYDARVLVPVGGNEPLIPYPELKGEELTVWRKYLPTQTPIENLRFSFFIETIPVAAISEIQRAQKTPWWFDRVEIWSRAADPMAVGVIGGENPRYYSIARWGDAQLTLDQIKKRLRFENRMLLLTWIIGGIFFTVTTLTVVLQSG